MNLSEKKFIKVNGGRLYVSKNNAFYLYCRENDGKVNVTGYIRFRRYFYLDKAFHDCSCFVAYEEDYDFFSKPKNIKEMDVEEKKEVRKEFPGDIDKVLGLLYITRENKNKHQGAVVSMHDTQTSMIEILYPLETL